MLGRAELVDSLRRHPFARALRVDKLTLAALEATLTGPPPPVALALTRTQAELLARAERIAAALPDHVAAEAGPSTAAVGGGGAPEVTLPSAAVRLQSSLAAPLRTGSPAVVGYVEHGRLVLDLIAVDPRDDAVLTEAVRQVASACT
jgi:L-seryl-tRNA(Ser) seleniumtransferase